MPRQWNAEKCYMAIREWLPPNQEFQYLTPKAELERIKDLRNDIFKIDTDLRMIAYWYGKHGVSEVSEGNVNDGLDHMTFAVFCEMIATVIDANLRKQMVKKAPCQFFKMDGLCLARAVAIGCTREAVVMGENMGIAGLEGIYFDLTKITISRFVMRLHAASLGIPDPFAEIPSKDLPAYRTILDHWRDVDPHPHLIPAIMEACDYHVAESHVSNRVPYEIEWDAFQLHPVEILMVLRLREQNGLPPLQIDHKLMHLPTARLLPVSPVHEYPAYLVRLVNRLKSETPDLAYGL